MDWYNIEKIITTMFFTIGIIALIITSIQTITPHDKIRFVNTKNLTFKTGNETYDGVKGFYKPGDFFIVSVQNREKEEIAYITMHEYCHYLNLEENEHFKKWSLKT